MGRYRYSDEELIKELQRIADKEGFVSRSVFDRESEINSTTLVNHFGKFNEAKRAAGIKTEPRGGKINGGIKGQEYYEHIINNSECVGCSEDENLCIQFHHVREKEKNISTMVSADARTSSVSIYEELVKTVPVCANCHQRHHSDESEFDANEYHPYEWETPEEVSNDSE